jgi:hemerythrin superfamily protein
MDPVELLKADHRAIEALFAEAGKALSTDEKRAFFVRIRQLFESHARVEETVFYPAFAHYESFDSMLDESYQDQQDILDMIDDMARTEDDQEFEEMLEDLRDDITRHVRHEEEVFFPKTRDVLERPETERLARMILDAKRGIHDLAA